MPRRRPIARKSFARRRIRRVKKYDHNVLPVRMKLGMPRMAELLEDELEDSVGLEEPIEDELTYKGVPLAEWPHYMGFAKRMLRLYRKFTGETLLLEKESLIEEYVLRGKDRNVLEQEQDRVEEYVGLPACPEGNYTTWSYLGRTTDLGDFDGNSAFLTVDNEGNIYVYTDNLASLQVIDKDFQGVFGTGRVGCKTRVMGSIADHNHYWEVQSTCKKYTVTFDCATHTMYIIQSYPIIEDPSSPPDWLPLFTRDIDTDYANILAGANGIFMFSISPNGKYIAIAVERDDSAEWYVMLYEGN